MIVTATIFDRAGIESAAVRRFSSPSITLYDDTPSMREVRELRIYRHGAATLETRRLFDYDPVRQRWATYGPVRLDDVAPRDVKPLARRMLAEVTAAGLVPCRHNTATHETFYPPGAPQ